MHVRWYGQSAFTLTRRDAHVDDRPVRRPLGATAGFRSTTRAEPHPADLLLVTHEHRDHNGVEAVTGEPHVVRSTAGPFDHPARRGGRHRVGARWAGGHGARAEHDLPVRARRPSALPHGRLRPARAAPRAAGCDRRHRRCCSSPSAAAPRSAPTGGRHDPRAAARVVVPMHYRTRGHRLPRAGRRLPRALRRVGDARPLRPRRGPPRPAAGGVGGAAPMIAPGR